MPGPIALADANAFYVSCERVFQPGLRGRAVVVLSNGDGCVIARSNEAKALSIAMGEPWHLCRRRLDTRDVIVRSSNYALYGDMSARVMRVLAGFTPELEVYSIDEAFLDLSGFGDRLAEHARVLRETVLRWTGIPVSVGIAPTKTLAKVANRRAKQDPACEGISVLIEEAAIDAELAGMALTDLWGVAGRLAARLREFGIADSLALKRTDPRFLRERFGVVLERLVRELRGTPCLALEDAEPERKSLIVSRSFAWPVTSRQELAEAVAAFAIRAAEKMRRWALAASRLIVFAHTDRFRPAEPQYDAVQPAALPVATADTGKLIGAALRALAALYRPGFRYKKAGVIFLDLVAAGRVTGGLFDAPDSAASQARMRVVDVLNRRFGRDTVTFAAAGAQRAWKLGSAFLSPRYTTRWDELLRV
jgi:DNA polymerase V